MPTIDIQLIKLSANEFACIMSFQKHVAQSIDKTTGDRVKPRGKISAVELPSFAVRLIQDGLLVPTECSKVAGIREMLQLCFCG